MYNDLFGQMKKTLGQLDKWLDTAETHAKAKNFDAAVLMSARLAPDFCASVPTSYGVGSKASVAGFQI